MTLHNRSGIAVSYSVNGDSEQLLAANEQVQIALPFNGILSLRLSLPYGSMWQRPTTRFHWLNRILRHSSLFDDEWSIAVSSLYEIVGLCDTDTVEITRRVSEFCQGYCYDCLFAESQNGMIVSEHHTVPDRKKVLKRHHKRFWKYILLMSCINGGIVLILGTLGMMLFSLFTDGEQAEAWVWVWVLLLFAGLTAWEFMGTGPWDPKDFPHLSKATKDKQITEFFRTHQTEYINL